MVRRFLLALLCGAAPLVSAAQGPVLELEGLPESTVSTDASAPPSVAASAPASAAAPAPAPAPAPASVAAAPSSVASEKSETLTDRLTRLATRTTIGGYGEHEYYDKEDEISTFVNHRWVLFVYSRMHERISMATEVEFEFAGSPVKKDGLLTHGEVLLEFAVVDFELAEWLVLRTGVILVPVGAYNLRHDSPTRDLVERPIAYTTVIPTTWFESGAGFHGKIPLGTQRVTYELYVVNGLDARIYDGQGLRAARGSHIQDNNPDKAFTGRVAYNPTLNVELGVSGYTGEYDLRQNRVNLGNIDLLWKLGPLELTAEAARVSVDEGFVEGFSGGSTANSRDAVPEDMWGYYGELDYHFTIGPLWDLFPADMKEATFTGVMRYEGKDTDTARTSSAGDARRLTFGLNFRPIEAFVLKTDYQLESHGTDEGPAPAEAWNGAFWSGERRARFGFVASAAYLF